MLSEEKAGKSELCIFYSYGTVQFINTADEKCTEIGYKICSETVLQKPSENVDCQPQEVNYCK